MLIQLIDRDKNICSQWREQFAGCSDVIIHNGDFFSLDTDCVVSPGNSFGFMDGGLDYFISTALGWQVQKKLQLAIEQQYGGELLVGQAHLIATDKPNIPYCIAAPTMRVPMTLHNTTNIYLATRAIFLLIKSYNKLYLLDTGEELIKTVSISGLGTGTGNVSPFDCAFQMKKAYDDFWLSKYEQPRTWREAASRHNDLIRK